MLKSRFITLVNIALDQAIVPEFIQDGLTPEAVASAVTHLLTDPAAHARQVRLLDQALTQMGRDDPPMAQRAANALVALLPKKDCPE
jgi:lipid-A-disaccharide synthase